MEKARTIIKHYFISGRVQGVGFRAFARRLAEGLKLSGWARNLADGRVEVLVQGARAEVESFEKKLKQGPAHGFVDKMVVLDIDPSQDLSGFEIRGDE